MPRAYTSYVSQVRRRSQRRRTAPGRWTVDGGRGTGEGGFETRPYVIKIKLILPIDFNNI
ncbi:MAG: hypothetical protein LBM98_11930 [Oscillospiraceae bacterium]|nr:hypothetical protein [Oscillospiraceae bacterium]